MSDKLRDILKTIGAIIIIGGIIVATFLYGNKQRQDQLQRDQQIKQQQQASKPSAPSQPAKPSQPSTPSNPPQSASGTNPANNNVAQQSGGANPAPSAPSNSQAQPQATQPAQTPATGTSIPQTGGGVLWLLPATAMLWLLRSWQRSKRALAAALRA